MTGDWTRVALTIAPADAELAADVLWRSGAAGVEEQEADGRVVLLGGFEDPAAAQAAADLAHTYGFAAEISAIVDDGLDGWRAWATPVLAGRTWITPTWVAAPEVGAEERIVRIDPGRTFGSGSHPTTRLVLGLLEGLVQPDDQVLDVGCGSGVLAVAAACFGAASVVAIDIDPDAPEITNANAERNGVSTRVTASNEPLAAVAATDRRFEVVAANLLAPVIAELAVDLVGNVAPNGALVVSGLLADRWEDTTTLLAPLRPVQVVEEDGWVAVLLR